VLRHPAAAWIAPFFVFIALLAGSSYLGLPERVSLLLILLLPALSLVFFSRKLLRPRLQRPIISLAVGVAVFLIWIAPDQLAPAWRGLWLFQNPLTGGLKTTLSAAALRDPVSLWLRAVRAVIVVPILEELFWRGWLMRWIIRPDFEKVPLGQYQARAFWITAALFALEHGPYWDVGLLAGVIYNAWMVRTKSVEDCILAHAVTNGCLAAYVVAGGHWQYWL